MKQYFLITVQRMCTDEDDNQVVVGWSGVIAEEDLPKLELKLAAEYTEEALKGSPFVGLRPMTEDEIREWRADN